MKTLFSVMTALALFMACADDGGSNAVIVTDPAEPPIVEPPAEDPEIGNIVIAYAVADETRFYDGQRVVTWKTGKAVPAGYRQICHGTMFYSLSQQGQTLTEKNTVGTGDFARVDGEDLWLGWNIPPQDAYDAGALYKDYLKVFKNSTQYGDWMTRQYKAQEFVAVSGDVFAYGVSGGWRHVNGTKTGIRVAVDGAFVVHNFNATTRTATIGGVGVSWATNFFNSANFWLKSGTTWYSQNGYRWDGVTLSETGCALDDWRTAPYPIALAEAPVVIAAGTRVEGGEACLYWIECNSGWVMRYVPSTNMLTQKVRIYDGDGYRATGLLMAATLRPVINMDMLFFNHTDGQMYKTDLVLNTTSLLGNSATWVMAW